MWLQFYLLATGGALALAAALLVLVDQLVDRWRQRRAERAAGKTPTLATPQLA